MQQLEPFFWNWIWDFEEYSRENYSGYEPLPSLPPSIILNRSFDWLIQEGEAKGKKQKKKNKKYSLSPQAEKKFQESLKKIIRKAKKMHLVLPASFLTFIKDPALRYYFLLLTAPDDFYTLDDGIVPLQDRPGEYLIKFYSDSQSCFFCFLHFSINGSYRVVISEHFFNPGYSLESYNEDLGLEQDDEKITSSAKIINVLEDDFETFLYRTWIENEIWETRYCGKPFNTIQKAYIESVKPFKTWD